MIDLLLEPFTYDFMFTTVYVTCLIGALCAFLSAFLMLKGWSLMGDALSHSIIPGVVGAYMLGLPFSLGAFFSGGLAAGAILFLNERTKLKEDAIIGLIFTSFFGIGLFMQSKASIPIKLDAVILGNLGSIAIEDIIQLVIIGVVSIAIMLVIWKDLLVTFFDENHARSIGINTKLLKIIFFTLLAASTVAAMQTVGAFLVIALVVTPGATAYLLSDRFSRLLLIAIAIGIFTSFFGSYISYFLNVQPGGFIVLLQTALFIIAFFFAPKHGYIAARLKAKQALEDDHA
ncbi:metal ABC transporter permease [Bartonella sp. HY406]|uniref:metal ABC transporter permease n=1 Tax=Bartonella sp. HY406 TaxID=2979331 RepID=UPI0021C7D00F|nr:metal ABC transporter permease [Bartonella sp. HY406]UXN02416.1 metal ABC transporter permease [Bartonella sp. HY406]